VNERHLFDHGYPHWPRPKTVQCPECALTMQIGETPRDDGKLVCPKCYAPFDPEEL
jgi:hypothetical protein